LAVIAWPPQETPQITCVFLKLFEWTLGSHWGAQMTPPTTKGAENRSEKLTLVVSGTMFDAKRTILAPVKTSLFAHFQPEIEFWDHRIPPVAEVQLVPTKWCRHLQFRNYLPHAPGIRMT